MTPGRIPEHWKGGGSVVGVCYYCGQPVKVAELARVNDPKVGVRRKAHAGTCAELLEARLGPSLEEGNHA